MTKHCKDKCCNLYDDIDENDYQYIIERLEDIVEISNFLIKVLKHKKMKEDTLNSITHDVKNLSSKEESKTEKKEKTDNDRFFELLRLLMKETPYSRYPYSDGYCHYYGHYDPNDVRF